MAVAAPVKKDPNEEHLKLLTIFYYIFAALSAVAGLMPIMHLGLGIMFLAAPPDEMAGNQGPPPELMGWIFIAAGGSMMVLMWTAAALMFTAARSIKNRRRYMLILIVAGLACVNFPLGTALGVFTLVVMLRPEVKTMFNQV